MRLESRTSDASSPARRPVALSRFVDDPDVAVVFVAGVDDLLRGRIPAPVVNVKRAFAVRELDRLAVGLRQRIELRRFGVFNVKPRKTGIGRNPRTGEEVLIPPGKAVRFKPGKELQSI